MGFLPPDTPGVLEVCCVFFLICEISVFSYPDFCLALKFINFILHRSIHGVQNLIIPLFKAILKV